MANIYVKEPPTNGKIRLVTSKGDIDIELWATEAPKACRNIIGLALEGYYDDCPFHRIVPGFIIQTGDPTGTGLGGESFFGEPFADEIHQRLRFTRRGLVACANANEPGTNESQFFITLDATPELQNKHTLFGRIEGPTIYNVLALADVELRQDEPDRPVYAPKLLTVQVLENPFDDIVPRITREERKEQERAKKEAARARRENRGVGKTKKNTALLSFGEAEEAEPSALGKGGSISSHDLLDDKRLKREAALAQPAFDIPVPPPSASASKGKGRATQDADADADSSAPSTKKRKTASANGSSATADGDDLTSLRATHASSKAAQSPALTTQISELESSLRGMSSARAKARAAAEEDELKKKKASRGRELLEEARRMYLVGAGKGATAAEESRKGKEKERTGTRAGTGPGPNEEATLAAMRRFQEGIRSTQAAEAKAKEERTSNGNGASALGALDEDVSALDREYGSSDDDDDDDDWRNHRLDAGGAEIVSARTKGAGGDRLDDYEVLDPRQPSAAAARLGFGATNDIARAREEQRRAEGRKGRDFVVERDWSRGGVQRNGAGGGGSESGSGRGRDGRDEYSGRDRGDRRGDHGRDRHRDRDRDGGYGGRASHEGRWDGRSGRDRDELDGRGGDSRTRRR